MVWSSASLKTTARVLPAGVTVATNGASVSGPSSCEVMITLSRKNLPWLAWNPWNLTTVAAVPPENGTVNVLKAVVLRPSTV